MKKLAITLATLLFLAGCGTGTSISSRSSNTESSSSLQESSSDSQTSEKKASSSSSDKKVKKTSSKSSKTSSKSSNTNESNAKLQPTSNPQSYKVTLDPNNPKESTFDMEAITPEIVEFYYPSYIYGTDNDHPIDFDNYYGHDEFDGPNLRVLVDDSSDWVYVDQFEQTTFEDAITDEGFRDLVLNDDTNGTGRVYKSKDWIPLAKGISVQMGYVQYSDFEFGPGVFVFFQIKNDTDETISGIDLSKFYLDNPEYKFNEMNCIFGLDGPDFKTKPVVPHSLSPQYAFEVISRNDIVRVRGVFDLKDESGNDIETNQVELHI